MPVKLGFLVSIKKPGGNKAPTFRSVIDISVFVRTAKRYRVLFL